MHAKKPQSRRQSLTQGPQQQLLGMQQHLRPQCYPLDRLPIHAESLLRCTSCIACWAKEMCCVSFRMCVDGRLIFLRPACTDCV